MGAAKHFLTRTREKFRQLMKTTHENENVLYLKMADFSMKKRAVQHSKHAYSVLENVRRNF